MLTLKNQRWERAYSYTFLWQCQGKPARVDIYQGEMSLAKSFLEETCIVGLNVVAGSLGFQDIMVGSLAYTMFVSVGRMWQLLDV